jgi:hypothetical protein
MLEAAIMGDLLVNAFCFERFGLTADFVSLPEWMHDSAKNWTVLYLCWVYKIKVRTKYGDAFWGAVFESAYATLRRVEETARFCGELSYWLEKLDYASRGVGTVVLPDNPADAPEELRGGMEVPMEYFGPLTMLALWPDSPFFGNADSASVSNGAEYELAEVFEKAKQANLRLIDIMANDGVPEAEMGAAAAHVGDAEMTQEKKSFSSRFKFVIVLVMCLFMAMINTLFGPFSSPFEWGMNAGASYWLPEFVG